VKEELLVHKVLQVNPVHPEAMVPQEAREKEVQWEQKVQLVHPVTWDIQVTEEKLVLQDYLVLKVNKDHPV